MNPWLVGIITSIIGTIAFTLMSNVNGIQFPILRFLNAFLGMNFILKLKSETKATKFIKKYCHRSNSVKVFRARGNSLILDRGNLNFLVRKNEYTGKVDCLLSGESEYLDARATEVANFNDSYKFHDNFKKYKDEVSVNRNNAAKLAAWLPNFTLKTHKEPIVFRFILTDDYLFLTFFSVGKYAKDKPVLMIPKGSEIYSGMTRYFDLVWKNSAEISLDELQDSSNNPPKKETTS